MNNNTYPTTTLLETASRLVQLAFELVNEAGKNESLDKYYGYSLSIIMQEFDKFSENNSGYGGLNSSLREIIENMPYEWQETEDHDVSMIEADYGLDLDQLLDSLGIH